MCGGLELLAYGVDVVTAAVRMRLPKPTVITKVSEIVIRVLRGEKAKVIPAEAIKKI